MQMFVALFRAVFVITVGMLAFVAITVALIADAATIRPRPRRGNPTRLARNPREVGQSKIVFVEEIVS